MVYNFDEIIYRRNSDSIKYDFYAERKKPEGILPLWVADMDFRTPPCVINALMAKSRHGIFGYSDTKQNYFDILQDWFLRNFNFTIQPGWLIKTPGVVYAISTAIRALTRKGDGVLILQPVYYPFEESILMNERKLAVSELVYSNGKYGIDFDDFEEKIIRRNIKLFILCSPHNPVGRVWTKEELVKLGDICFKRNVVVVSDEIHADFIYAGHKHLVFANLKPEFQDMTITCTAPSKTFNLAGLQISNIFIANSSIRREFKNEMAKSGYSQPNVMGLEACKAAYSGGAEWLAQLREYLTQNLDFIRSFLSERLARVKLVEPEGTYLVWLDFKELGICSRKLDDLIENKAGLWLDSGTMFGAGGEGFQRVNIACPGSILSKAFRQLEQAINQREIGR